MPFSTFRHRTRSIDGFLPLWVTLRANILGKEGSFVNLDVKFFAVLTPFHSVIYILLFSAWENVFWDEPCHALFLYVISLTMKQGCTSHLLTSFLHSFLVLQQASLQCRDNQNFLIIEVNNYNLIILNN